MHFCCALLLGLVVGPPQRRTVSSDHLYSFGSQKLRREATIGGTRATDLLCWPHIKGQPCDCEGQRAHIFAGACGKFLSGALGACAGCARGDACSKPHPPKAMASLLAWYTESIGPPVLGTVPIVRQTNVLAASLSRSAQTAAGFGGPPRICTVPAAKVRERLCRHAESSTHVARLLEEPFVDELLAHDTTRRLLAQRGSVKEVSEAYAAADEIRRLAVDALGVPADAAASGIGLTVLDVCSGKGVVGHLLSRAFPEAEVVMLDACTQLDLTHVTERPNLRFVELDLFSKECASVLHELAAAHDDGGVVIAVGMHLCSQRRAHRQQAALLSCKAHQQRKEAC